MTHQCKDCGAGGQFGSCSQLFDGLLALDHQRLQPWGRFHGLNVACFLLQHPSHQLAVKESALGGQWQHVTTFVDDGLDAVYHLEAQRVRANRHGRSPWLDLESPPPRKHRVSSTTIEDVSVDGTFPADAYPQRMLAWAVSIRAERSTT